VRERSDLLNTAEVDATCATIAELQLPNGMIPWFPDGHADPWNHVEAAMALALGGYCKEAERAYEWLSAIQHFDGSWCAYYLADGVEDAKRDTNVCAYIATGVWHHYLLTGDYTFLEHMWPVIERAIEFVLSYQMPGGELRWMVEADGTPGAYALLTGSSSTSFSVRCAIAIAEHLGFERPGWELAVGRLAHAVAFAEDSFEPKTRWAMDWYYPVLCGALKGDVARARLAERWLQFVMPGLGVRCVSDADWVTAAETSELVLTLDAIGQRDLACTVLGWTRHMRHDDGSYYTGCVHPQCVRFPGGERSSYTAAAVVLANHALTGSGPTAGLFRGEGVPIGLDLQVNEPVAEP
jgi:MMP endo-(1,4)-3-O-methyl-alpha-D-mannosidase